ncbi:MAG: protein phosphatase, partial [Gallionellaceae bacterium]
MDIQEALEMACQTHPGMVRAHNEDSVECDESCGLAVVADGMGGYTAGEVASGITISVMFSEVKQRI